jgi:hypothetical protein
VERGVRLFELAAMLERSHETGDNPIRVARIQQKGAAWTARDGAGEALACMGLFPLPRALDELDKPPRYEMWCCFADDARRHMAGLLRLAHWTLDNVRQNAQVEIRTFTVTPSGARMARLIGFRSMGGAPEQWVLPWQELSGDQTRLPASK